MRLSAFLLTLTFTIIIAVVVPKGNISFFAVKSAFGSGFVRLDPNNMSTNYNLAVSYLNNRNYDTAINIALKIIEMKPDYADGYYILGVSLFAKGKYLYSIKELQDAKIALQKYQSLGGKAPGDDGKLIGKVDNLLKDIPAAQKATAPSLLADKLELYTLSTCPNCHRAIQFFKSKRIPIVIYDVRKDENANVRFHILKKKIGARNGRVPLAVIYGKIIDGYSPEQYLAAMK